MIAGANFLSCVVTGNGYLENLAGEMAGWLDGLMVGGGGQIINVTQREKCQHNY